MYSIIRISAITFVFFFTFGSLKANDGEQLFKNTCAACHTIGAGRLVGPDLLEISTKRNQDWLVSFIRSSTAMINSGDRDALDIYNEYSRMLMPDNDLSTAQIVSIIDFIAKESSSESVNTNQSATDILINTTTENVKNGLLLFSGNKPLANNGVACVACHKVRDERIFSSGTLAKDLSDTYDVMGGSGVAAILRNPPFPAMFTSYKNHMLSEEEVIDITSYLKSVSEERYYQRPSDFSTSFALLGIFVFLFIFMITIIVYFKRKKRPVNQSILDRQSKVIN